MLAGAATPVALFGIGAVLRRGSQLGERSVPSWQPARGVKRQQRQPAGATPRWRSRQVARVILFSTVLASATFSLLAWALGGAGHLREMAILRP